MAASWVEEKRTASQRKVMALTASVKEAAESILGSQDVANIKVQKLIQIVSSSIL